MDLKHITQGNQDEFPIPAGLTAKGHLSKVDEVRAGAAEVSFESKVLNTGEQDTFERLRAFVSGQRKELGASLEDIENMLIRLALEKSEGNVTAAAQVLGMSRAQVSYRMKSW